MADPASSRRKTRWLWPTVIALLALVLVLVLLSPLGGREDTEPEGIGVVGEGLPGEGEPAATGPAAPTVDTQPTEAIPVPVPPPVDQTPPPAQQTPPAE